MATTTVLLQENFLASVNAGSQALRLRLTDSADSVRQFQFVKPSSTGSWADSNANRFIIEPDDAAGKAKFNYARGADAKNIIEVNLMAMGAPVTVNSDFVNVATTATINNLNVTNLRVDNMTVVEGTQTIVLNVTDDKVKAAYLDISGSATLQTLTVTGATDLKSAAKANSLAVTGAATVSGAVDLQGAVSAGSLVVTGASNLKGAVDAASLAVTGAAGVGAALAVGRGIEKGAARHKKRGV
jgi:cytoskeletal protein CcmA (bactofilin family)